MGVSQMREAEQPQGDVTRRGLLSLPEFVLRRIEPEPMSGCWLWVGASGEGYGLVRLSNPRRQQGAHRYVYEQLVGPITQPLLDHVCRVRCCVNPAHLRPVTAAENIMARGSLALAKMYADRECCDRCGGQLDPLPGRGRQCYACARARWREAGRRRRARLAGAQ